MKSEIEHGTKLVRLSFYVTNRLHEMGKRGESYDQIVRKLLAFRKKHQQKKK